MTRMHSDRKSTIGGCVMTRKVGEVVVLNNGQVTIQVVDIAGGRVKVAIKAPKEWKIDRVDQLPLAGGFHEDA